MVVVGCSSIDSLISYLQYWCERELFIIMDLVCFEIRLDMDKKAINDARTGIKFFDRNT